MFIQKVGEARAIVRKHFDDEMGRLSPTERNVASDVCHYLVTPSVIEDRAGARLHRREDRAPG